MAKKINVLLADDSKVILSLVKKLIKDVEGINTIETADSLLHARAMVMERGSNVIVLDLQLSGENGIDFLKWIKFFNPLIKVIIFSNNADDCHRAITKEYGADHFLDKSIEFTSLPHILNTIVNEMRSMQH